jgi:hypothetical protein
MKIHERVDVETHIFLTLALVEDALHPGKYLPVPIVQEAVWASKPVWTTCKFDREKHVIF